MSLYAVVPYDFLVWYNKLMIMWGVRFAVVPYYFLVWYNIVVVQIDGI